MTDSLNLYYAGLAASTLDVAAPSFDVDAAIASFDYDPPDSPFQRGYLRGLIKCGYATISSKWDYVDENRLYFWSTINREETQFEVDMGQDHTGAKMECIVNDSLTPRQGDCVRREQGQQVQCQTIQTFCGVMV